jgi:predicted RNA-binding Zn ribbon-like protein
MSTYYQYPGTLAQDLCNTIDVTRPKPEYLREPADLAQYLHAWNITTDGAPDEHDLVQVRALRDRLRAVFEAKDLAEAASRLNSLLDGAALTPRVVVDPAGSIDLELSAGSDEPLARRLAIAAAIGLSATIRQYGIDRLHICQAAPCREVFIDTTRNHTRRYCCEQCANRHNVSAYRQRRRNEPHDREQTAMGNEGDRGF